MADLFVQALFRQWKLVLVDTDLKDTLKKSGLNSFWFLAHAFAQNSGKFHYSGQKFVAIFSHFIEFSLYTKSLVLRIAENFNLADNIASTALFYLIIAEISILQTLLGKSCLKISRELPKTSWKVSWSSRCNRELQYYGKMCYDRFFPLNRVLSLYLAIFITFRSPNEMLAPSRVSISFSTMSGASSLMAGTRGGKQLATASWTGWEGVRRAMISCLEIMGRVTNEFSNLWGELVQP